MFSVVVLSAAPYTWGVATADRLGSTQQLGTGFYAGCPSWCSPPVFIWALDRHWIQWLGFWGWEWNLHAKSRNLPLSHQDGVFSIDVISQELKYAYKSEDYFQCQKSYSWSDGDWSHSGVKTFHYGIMKLQILAYIFYSRVHLAVTVAVCLSKKIKINKIKLLRY